MADPASESKTHPKKGPAKAGAHESGTATPGAEPQGDVRQTEAHVNEPGTVAHLLRQLVDDVSLLFRKELALASSEVSHSFDEAKQGVGGLATGGAVLYAGVLFLLLAATLGLAEIMSAWLAALIVGAVVALIGFGMVQSGRKKMRPSSFTPDRAAGSVRKDKEMIGRQTHEHTR